jgi:predicted nucleic acid-binding protein
MQILVDTGVLLRAFDRSSSDQKTIFRAFRKLWADGHELATTHQNIAEFWNVATRPQNARGGFGLTCLEAERRLVVIEKLGTILTFNNGCYVAWRQIITKHSIVGVAVHDARLVGVMEHYRISHVVTLNSADFRRYGSLVVWTPADVLSNLAGN